ncbi:MAG: hypothetical protein K2O32_11100 [Acetatifactor sp.]|nr:hypothetical protein [Acetatifactor sp.]
MDMYLYCLIKNNYALFIDSIIQFLKEILHEHIQYKGQYQQIYDYIGCSLFDMYIESEYTSEECNLDFTLSDYQIKTNVSVYITIYTGKIETGIYILEKMVKQLENLFGANIIVLDDSSAAVYIHSSSQFYVDKIFWSPKSR